MDDGMIKRDKRKPQKSHERKCKKDMKKKMLAAALLLAMTLVLGLAGCGKTGAAGTSVSFQTTDLDGNQVDSKELFARNKITMINIWGTYCGPCIDEMPELEKMSQEYADKGVTIVGLVVDVQGGDDTNLAEAQDIVKKTGVTYQNLRAWEGSGDQLSAPGTPTTYFVDSEGKLVGEPIVGANVDGYRTSLDELLK